MTFKFQTTPILDSFLSKPNQNAVGKEKETFLKNFNNILKEDLAFDDSFLFDENKMPGTIGKIVATVFHSHIYNQVLKKNISLKQFVWATTKHGFLTDKVGHKYEEAKEIRRRLSIGTLDIEQIPLSHFSNYKYDAFNMASVTALYRTDHNDQRHWLAYVTGGRCNNKRSKSHKLGNVLNMDFVSCYGALLSDLSYPVGTPKIYCPSINEDGITLEKFLKENRHDFYTRGWKIVVNGDLSFEQDLIYSKIQPRTFSDENLSFKTPQLDHALLRKEIRNGVITQDLLEIIEAVATTKELKDWMSLEVKSAIWYPKEDYIPDIQSWVEESLLAEENCFEGWTDFPISTFIDLLLEKKKLLKDRVNFLKEKVDSNTLTEDEEKIISDEISLLNSRDKQIKLVVNTFYGAITSRYFRINNVVVADNITARVRANIWKALKALNGVQSITDGFVYQPSNVNGWKTENKTFRKAGFNSLSSYDHQQQHRYHKKISLGNYDWDSLFKTLEIKRFCFEELNQIAHKTIDTFWEPYGVEGCCFKLEHLMEKTSFAVAFWGKATYMLKTVFDEIVVKARGHCKSLTNVKKETLFYDDGDNDYDNDPVFEHVEKYQEFEKNRNKVFRDLPVLKWLYILIEDKKVLPKPEDLSYQKKRRISFPIWRTNYKNDSTYLPRPGDYVTDDTHFTINRNHLPLITEKDYKRKKNELIRKNKKSYFDVKNPLTGERLTPQEMLDRMHHDK